jgi:DNA-binding NarL/FixJ family response regulator
MNVLIVDDHPILHEALGAIARSVLTDASVSCARTLEEACERASEFALRDLVLLNLGLPGCVGLSALEAFRTRFPALRTIVVSAREDRTTILCSLELGAVGYVPKTHDAALIAAALRLVAEGGIYVPPQAIEGNGGEGDARAPLTGRQLDVLRLIARGLANKEIAQELQIAKDTVKQHAKAVYTALGIATRSQAARAAERRGIKLD